MTEYIDRSKVIWITTETGALTTQEKIKALPVADVAPVVHGWWENVFQDGACSWSGQCSVCSVRNDIPHPFLAHYCPNCGAKMDGGKNNGKT